MKAIIIALATTLAAVTPAHASAIETIGNGLGYAFLLTAALVVLVQAVPVILLAMGIWEGASTPTFIWSSDARNQR